MAEQKQKASYVGAPAIFALEQACRQINEAFGRPSSCGCCYLVGSAIEGPGWRDVDVRFIMPDEEFCELFPDAHADNALWEHDQRWLLMTTAISERMSKVTGLPVDFQFQPQMFANKHHDKRRHAIGLSVVKPERNSVAERPKTT